MGFTLSRSTGTRSGSVWGMATPEEMEAGRLRQQAIEYLPSPVIHGSEKQIAWANKIVITFLFYASHRKEFTLADLQEFFKTPIAQSSKFWIDNRNIRAMSGETLTAVENAIAEMKRRQQAEAKANQTIAEMSPQQLAAKVRRF